MMKLLIIEGMALEVEEGSTCLATIWKQGRDANWQREIKKLYLRDKTLKSC